MSNTEDEKVEMSLKEWVKVIEENKVQVLAQVMNIVSAPEAVEVLLDVPAGQNVTHHRFRISPGPQSSDLCIKTTPATFVEINLRLYRVC